MITNSKLGEFYFYCKTCIKDVSCSQVVQVSDLFLMMWDIVTQSLAKKRKRNRFFCLYKELFRRYSQIEKKKKDILTGKAENKFYWLNIISQTAIAAADHVSALVKECFPDSKIVQSYSCAKKKRFCVLNRAISPELQQIIDRLNEDSQHIIIIKLVYDLWDYHKS